MKITTVPLPDQSLASESFDVIHYADSFAVSLPTEKSISIHDIFIATQNITFPNWLRALSKTRDILGGIVELKPIGEKPPIEKEIKVGQRFGLFRVIAIAESEFLMGEDDSHLNFRVSYHLSQHTPQTFTMSSTVHYNNRWGRIYFVLVKPFHALIVPVMMRRICAQL